LEPALEQSAGRKRARLVRRPCAQLRITGTDGEICVGFLRADGFDAPFDADLAAQRLPVGARRSLGIGGQFSAFPAVVSGVEDEAAIIKTGSAAVRNHIT